MSVFGSSVINKSSKKLAPKAPSQRRRPLDTVSQAASVVVQVPSRNASRYDMLQETSGDARLGEQQDRRQLEDGRVEPARKRRRVEFAPSETIENFAREDLNRPLPSTEIASHDDSAAGRSDIHATRSEGGAVRKSSRLSVGKAGTRQTRAGDTAVGTAATRTTRRTRSQANRAESVDASDPPSATAAQTSGDNAVTSDRESEAQGVSIDREGSVPLKKKRRRAKTPPGAEEIQIDPSAVRMSDLGKDSRTGKKSRLETQFQAIDWSEVARKRKEAEAAALREEEEAEEQGRAPNTQGPAARQGTAEEASRVVDADEEPNAPTAAALVNHGPQLKLVNGEIVINPSSLTIDRHADAIRNGDDLPEEESNALTRRINTQSWIYDSRRDPRERRRLTNKSDPWSSQQTDAFYDALRMFGTDFFIISKMFPGRTRRHIKLKFVREERSAPSRIHDALVGGRVPMDIDHYSAATGRDSTFYKDPAVIQADLVREEEAQRQEIERQRAEAMQAARERKEEARRAKEERMANRSKGKVGRKNARPAPDEPLAASNDVLAAEA